MPKSDDTVQIKPRKFRQIFLLVLGSFFAASLPWGFILAIPGAASFYLLQPIPLMFITYPAIYIVAGFLVKTFSVQPLLALVFHFAAFALVISQAIAWAAAPYFGFYLVFFLIGFGVKGLIAARKQKIRAR